MKLFDKEHRVGADTCAVQSETQQNDKISNYMLFNTYMGTTECDDTTKLAADMTKLREFATENNLRIRDGYGVINPCNIDTDYSLRFNDTRERARNQMFTRTFQAVPNLSKGNVNVLNESKIQQGNDTWNLHDCEEQQFNVFTPMIPCLANSIQDPKNIIEAWTRGGEVTRDSVKQQEFLEKQGYTFDDKCVM